MNFLKNKPPLELFLWGLIAFLLSILLLLPVLGIFSAFFGEWSSEEQESWHHVREYLLPSALNDTLILTIGSMLGALLLGIPPAWILSRKQFRGHSIISILLVLPLAIPAYILSYLITDLREALVPFLLQIRTSLGVDTYLAVEEGSRYFILTLVFSAVLYPYIFLAARSAFTGNLKTLEEASLSLGRNTWQTFWNVQLPLARPAIVSSLFLVAMEVMNDYGAVKHFGFNTFTIVLFRTWFGLGELAIAQKLASWILLGILALLMFEKLQRGRISYAQKRAQARHSSTTRLSISESFVLFIPIALGLCLPFILLLKWMTQATLSESVTQLGKALLNSLSLGAGVVGTTLLLALIITGFVRFSKQKFSRYLHYFLQIAGYACPGAVMAIVVLTLLGWKDLLPLSIEWASATTIFGILFALSCRYYSVAAQMVYQALERLPKSYDDASQSLGQKLSLSYLNVHLPLISPALFSATALVFIDVTKELPLSLLLRPFDFETLGTLTYGLVDQGQLYDCALPSATLIFLCACGIIFVERAGWRKHS